MVDWPCDFLRGVVPLGAEPGECDLCARAVVVPPAALAAKARALCYECDLDLVGLGPSAR